MPDNTIPIAYINLHALCDNYVFIQQLVGKSKVAVVIKANAYGLGLKPLANTLNEIGCHDFFVSRPDEAIELRALLPNQDIHIYLLSGAPHDDALYRTLCQHHITIVINNEYEWQFIKQQRQQVNIALHIETGMNRMAIKEHECADIALDAAQQPFINIQYIMSHLAAADTPNAPSNAQQLNKFQQICDEYFSDYPRSLCNSPGVFLGKEYHFDMVRVGYALYGGNPTADNINNPIQQILTLSAPIAQIYHLKKGEGISYNHVFKAPKDMMVACVHIGYADGMPRFDDGNQTIGGYIGDDFCQILGRVTMDLSVLDISHLKTAVKIGDHVQFIGDKLPLHKAYGVDRSFGYQSLTNLSARVKREYLYHDK